MVWKQTNDSHLEAPTILIDGGHDVKRPDLTALTWDPVFSERAWRVLAPMLGAHVEALPLSHKKWRYYAVHVLLHENCLDLKKSTVVPHAKNPKLFGVQHPVFLQNFKPQGAMFRIFGDVYGKAYVTEEFVRAVEVNALLGGKFEQVFPELPPEPEPPPVCEEMEEPPYTGAPNEYGPLDPARLKNLEKTIGQPLPDDLRNYLVANNGGCPKDHDLWLPRKRRPSGMVHTVFGLHNGPKYQRLDSIWEEYKKHMLAGLLPFADDGGGNFYCIQLKGRDRGKIYGWNHEDGYAETPRKAHFDFVANSFTEFLSFLKPPRRLTRSKA